MRIFSLVLLGLLAGCANGVVMTEAEVRSLVGRAINEGFHRGWADAVKQGSKNL